MSPEILKKPREKEVVHGQDLTSAKKALGEAKLNGMFESAAKVSSERIRVKKK